MNQTQTKEACQKALSYYESIWGKDKGDSFWQKANQVHSYLRFAEVASKAFPHQPEDEDWYGLLQNDTFFQDFWIEVNKQLTPTSGSWVDDYGWAGLACLAAAKLYKEKNFTSPTWQNWRDKAFDCFTHMQQSAYQSPSLGGSPIANGLSNCPSNPKPDERYLKNTVTNAMWFLLPITLYDWCVTNSSDHPAPSVSPLVLLQTAYDQYRWFRNWISTKPNAKPGDWDHDIPFYFFRTSLPTGTYTAGLLEDRPVAFPSDSKNYTYNPNSSVPWSPDGVWSGDQGLFLAACALFSKYAQDLQSELNYLPTVVTEVQNNTKIWFSIVTYGVFWFLCNSQPGQDGIIREAPFSFTFIGGFRIDYMCGRGVLARFMSLEITLAFFQSIFKEDLGMFNSAYERTALAISKLGDEGGNLKADWSSDMDNNTANGAFFDLFGPVKGLKVTDFDFSWDQKSPELPDLWNNYCMMSRFDIYTAFIRSNDW